MIGIAKPLVSASMAFASDRSLLSYYLCANERSRLPGSGPLSQGRGRKREKEHANVCAGVCKRIIFDGTHGFPFGSPRNEVHEKTRDLSSGELV